MRFLIHFVNVELALIFREKSVGNHFIAAQVQKKFSKKKNGHLVTFSCEKLWNFKRIILVHVHKITRENGIWKFFYWNNHSLRSFGLLVNPYPPLPRPPRRHIPLKFCLIIFLKSNFLEKKFNSHGSKITLVIHKVRRYFFSQNSGKRKRSEKCLISLYQFLIATRGDGKLRTRIKSREADGSCIKKLNCVWKKYKFYSIKSKKILRHIK